ncbi:MAG TPA: CHASE3 domain-containing protein [Bryobacteraceae bacterium]|nr:CHASE3 domain-containing protein [Bryobacteraceae bacterium]
MSSPKDLLRDRGPALLHVPGVMLSAAMLILLVMIGLAYRDWKQYASARATGFRVLDIQNSLEALESNLRDAEAGQRGFLLTGANIYLEPYTRAIEIVPAEVSNLDKLLRSPTGEADPNVSRLKTAVNEKLVELRETVDLRNRQGIAPATDVVLSDRGKKAMDEVRNLCFSVRQQIASDRRNVQAQALAATRGSFILTTSGSLILMALIVTGFLMISNRTRDREEALAGIRGLYDLGTRTMLLSDLRSVLAEILQTAEKLTAADKGNIQLLDASGALRIEAQRGFSSEFLDFFNAVQGGEAATCATALGSRQQVVVEDVQKSSIFIGTPALKVLLGAGVRAVQSTPLISRSGNLVGMLSTHYRRPHKPSDQDLRLLTLFARQAADLIEKFRAERELRATKDQLQLVTDQMAAAVTRCRRDQHYVWVSRRYAEWLHRPPREIMGRPIVEVLGEQGYAAILPYIQRVLSGERVEYSAQVNFLGVGQRWIRAVYVPTYAEDQQVDGWIAVVADVTEERHTAEQLRQSQRLESLGVLAGGIAHDFNNLLVGMLGNASLALDVLGPMTPARQMLENVNKSAERAAALTRQMLAYAGKESLVTQSINISNLINELGTLLRTSIPKNVALKLELPPSLPYIEADHTQLHQVIMNLVINAAEAIPESMPGTVTISAESRALTADDHEHAIVPLPPNGKSYVAVTVTDTGQGMSPEIQSRIFEPFFTTKFTGRGLGLSAVLGIVKAHQGGIALRTSPGSGTAIALLFPPAQTPLSNESRLLPQTLPGSGTVLVIDDEEAVREVVRTTLERHGYQVLLAENGQRGIEMFRAHPEVVAILLDLAMPVMSGEQAAPEFRKINAAIPIIVSTGYPEGEARRRLNAVRATAFLQKPYKISALIEMLTASLAGRGSFGHAASS